MNKFLLVSVAFIVVLFSSCEHFGGKRMVRGDGNVVTQERPIPSFKEVKSSGSFDVILASGPVASVKIEAEENLHDYIETRVEGDVLSIRTRDGYWLRTKRDIRIFVTAPTLDAVKVYGSGNINSQGTITGSSDLKLEIHGSGDIDVQVNAPKVEAEISGSGNMHLSGETKTFNSQINGNGDIRALDLKSEETRVEINGSGNAEVFSSVKLEVEVRGSGDVTYRGNGQVLSDIKGSGGVRKVD